MDLLNLQYTPQGEARKLPVLVIAHQATWDTAIQI